MMNNNNKSEKDEDNNINETPRNEKGNNKEITLQREDFTPERMKVVLSKNNKNLKEDLHKFFWIKENEDIINRIFEFDENKQEQFHYLQLKILFMIIDSHPREEVIRKIILFLLSKINADYFEKITDEEIKVQLFKLWYYHKPNELIVYRKDFRNLKIFENKFKIYSQIKQEFSKKPDLPKEINDYLNDLKKILKETKKISIKEMFVLDYCGIDKSILNKKTLTTFKLNSNLNFYDYYIQYFPFELYVKHNSPLKEKEHKKFLEEFNNFLQYIQKFTGIIEKNFEFKTIFQRLYAKNKTQKSKGNKKQKETQEFFLLSLNKLQRISFKLLKVHSFFHLQNDASLQIFDKFNKDYCEFSSFSPSKQNLEYVLNELLESIDLMLMITKILDDLIGIKHPLRILQFLSIANSNYMVLLFILRHQTQWPLIKSNYNLFNSFCLFNEKMWEYQKLAQNSNSSLIYLVNIILFGDTNINIIDRIPLFKSGVSLIYKSLMLFQNLHSIFLNIADYSDSIYCKDHCTLDNSSFIFPSSIKYIKYKYLLELFQYWDYSKNKELTQLRDNLIKDLNDSKGNSPCATRRDSFDVKIPGIQIVNENRISLLQVDNDYENFLNKFLCLVLDENSNENSNKDSKFQNILICNENLKEKDIKLFFKRIISNKSIKYKFIYMIDNLTAIARRIIIEEIIENAIKKKIHLRYLIIIYNKENELTQWIKQNYINKQLPKSKKKEIKDIKEINGEIKKIKIISPKYIDKQNKQQEDIIKFSLCGKSAIEFMYKKLLELKNLQNYTLVLQLNFCDLVKEENKMLIDAAILQIVFLGEIHFRDAIVKLKKLPKEIHFEVSDDSIFLKLPILNYLKNKYLKGTAVSNQKKELSKNLLKQEGLNYYNNYKNGKELPTNTYIETSELSKDIEKIINQHIFLKLIKIHMEHNEPIIYYSSSGFGKTFYIRTYSMFNQYKIKIFSLTNKTKETEIIQFMEKFNNNESVWICFENLSSCKCLQFILNLMEDKELYNQKYENVSFIGTFTSSQKFNKDTFFGFIDYGLVVIDENESNIVEMLVSSLNLSKENANIVEKALNKENILKTRNLRYFSFIKKVYLSMIKEGLDEREAIVFTSFVLFDYKNEEEKEIWNNILNNKIKKDLIEKINKINNNNNKNINLLYLRIYYCLINQIPIIIIRDQNQERVISNNIMNIFKEEFLSFLPCYSFTSKTDIKVFIDEISEIKPKHNSNELAYIYFNGIDKLKEDKRSFLFDYFEIKNSGDNETALIPNDRMLLSFIGTTTEDITNNDNYRCLFIHYPQFPERETTYLPLSLSLEHIMEIPIELFIIKENPSIIYYCCSNENSIFFFSNSLNKTNQDIKEELISIYSLASKEVTLYFYKRDDLYPFIEDFANENNKIIIKNKENLYVHIDFISKGLIEINNQFRCIIICDDNSIRRHFSNKNKEIYTLNYDKEGHNIYTKEQVDLYKILMKSINLNPHFVFSFAKRLLNFELSRSFFGFNFSQSVMKVVIIFTSTPKFESFYRKNIILTEELQNNPFLNVINSFREEIFFTSALKLKDIKNILDKFLKKPEKDCLLIRMDEYDIDNLLFLLSLIDTIEKGTNKRFYFIITLYDTNNYINSKENIQIPKFIEDPKRNNIVFIENLWSNGDEKSKAKNNLFYVLSRINLINSMNKEINLLKSFNEWDEFLLTEEKNNIFITLLKGPVCSNRNYCEFVIKFFVKCFRIGLFNNFIFAKNNLQLPIINKINDIIDISGENIENKLFGNTIILDCNLKVPYSFQFYKAIRKRMLSIRSLSFANYKAIFKDIEEEEEKTIKKVTGNIIYQDLAWDYVYLYIFENYNKEEASIIASSIINFWLNKFICHNLEIKDFAQIIAFLEEERDNMKYLINILLTYEKKEFREIFTTLGMKEQEHHINFIEIFLNHINDHINSIHRENFKNFIENLNIIWKNAIQAIKAEKISNYTLIQLLTIIYDSKGEEILLKVFQQKQNNPSQAINSILKAIEKSKNSSTEIINGLLLFSKSANSDIYKEKILKFFIDCVKKDNTNLKLSPMSISSFFPPFNYSNENIKDINQNILFNSNEFKDNLPLQRVIIQCLEIQIFNTFSSQKIFPSEEDTNQLKKRVLKLNNENIIESIYNLAYIKQYLFISAERNQNIEENIFQDAITPFNDLILKYIKKLRHYFLLTKELITFNSKQNISIKKLCEYNQSIINSNKSQIFDNIDSNLCDAINNSSSLTSLSLIENESQDLKEINALSSYYNEIQSQQQIYLQDFFQLRITLYYLMSTDSYFSKFLTSSIPKIFPGRRIENALLLKSFDKIENYLEDKNHDRTTYICPCGQWYTVGECGFSIKTFKCSNCKHSIGGKNHQLLMKENHFLVCLDEEDKKKLMQSPYCTGNNLKQLRTLKQLREQFVNPWPHINDICSIDKKEGELSTLGYRFIFFILYSLIQWGKKFKLYKDSEVENIEKGANLDKLAKENWKVLNIILKSNGVYNVIDFMEKAFAILKDIDIEQEVNKDNIKKYEMLIDKKINGIVKEIENSEKIEEENLIEEKKIKQLFYISEIPRKNEIKSIIYNTKNSLYSYPILTQMYDNKIQDDIKLFNNIYLINPIVNFCYNNYSSITREEAESTEINIEHSQVIQKMIDDYEMGWKGLNLQNKIELQEEKDKKYLTNYFVDSKTLIGRGNELHQAYNVIIQKHNEILDKILNSISEKNQLLYDIKNSVNKGEMLNYVQEAKIGDLFSFEFPVNIYGYKGIEDLIDKYLIPKEPVNGIVRFEFDLKSIEEELVKILLFNKKKLSNDQKEIKYNEERIIKEIEKNDNSQQNLDDKDKNNVKEFYNALDNKEFFIDALKTLYLANSQGEYSLINERIFNSFIKKVILNKENIDKEKAFESFKPKIWNFIEFCEFLLEQSILNEVESNFNEKLSEDDKKKLNEHFKNNNLLIDKDKLHKAIKIFLHLERKNTHLFIEESKEIRNKVLYQRLFSLAKYWDEYTFKHQKFTEERDQLINTIENFGLKMGDIYYIYDSLSKKI